MRLSTAVLWAAAMLVGLQSCASSSDSIVDRSSRNLSSVPTDLPQTAESVNLACNRIHQLHYGDFKNITLLKFLNVSWNGLELIDAETFLDTPLLEVLDLSHNRLQNLSAQRYLLHASNLVVLNLAWNGFLNMTLGSEFSFLVKLKRLALGAENISVGDFANIGKVKLQSMNLFLEEQLDYEAGSLIDVDAHRLQIVFNGDQSVLRDLFGDALSHFLEVEIKNLTGGYKNLIMQLGEKRKIRTSHLFTSKVRIYWKDLTEFVNAALRTSISHLSSSDVAIDKPPYFDTHVTETSDMKSFTVRRGVVNSFFFSQEAMYDFFINIPVKQISIQYTAIIHMTCPEKLSPVMELDFSYCALSDSMFSSVKKDQTVECKTLVNLTKLFLVGNNIKNVHVLSKRVQYMMSLQHLDLSLNSLVYDGLSECLWPPNITIMNMSSGGLTDTVFKCLPKGVETLDLQNNQITVVPPSIFELRKLSSLNLNFNRLRDLPVCNTFPLLNKLLLRSNSLHAPSVNKLETCPNLKTLDVSHNPFTCTCILRDFISLGTRAENKKTDSGIELLGWPSSYYCTYPEDVRDTILKGFWIPEVSCSVSVLAATILIPAVALIVTVVFLCHRCDVLWYMGMIWQWTRAKHRARMQHIRPEDLVGVEFHAFVSYSQHDADWVKNSLLPNLEGPAGGLRVCHHERSFVPGKTIVDNIISCVEKSRRCVFVLSAHFVKSEWCHYELYFASHQRLSLGSDSIVLVMLEPLPQYLIPSKYYQLKSMMSRNTFLEWPQDRAKHRLFWANLRAALQADLPNAPVTETEE
ncbi:toll-like receptor 1 [Leuresthes tenuis]|uniref:toll-like receptor 1 n=1 Tax=Leuresthes tenuis TaxID=355514 RepID=UPI003B50D56D